MKIIEARNMNELAMKSYKSVLNSGITSTNRNAESLGDIYVEYDVSLILSDIRSRHLYLTGRKSNIFAVMAEMFWVMAGREDVEYLSHFLPRAKDYSDDGMTWRASYGSRMYEYGQLQNVIDKFTEDGLYTRQASLSILHPEKDSKESLKKVYGLDKTKDTPCNQWLQFYVNAKDNTFNMKVQQRSGDLAFGTLNINVPEFTFLQEFVFQMVSEKYPQIKMGTYHHNVTNFHIYEATSDQIRSALDQNFSKSFIQNEKEAIFPKSLDLTKSFFNSLCDEIVSTEPDGQTRVTNLFKESGLKTRDNIIYDYAIFTELFLRNKRQGFKNASKIAKSAIHIPDLCLTSKDLINSVTQSTFRNFEF